MSSNRPQPPLPATAAQPTPSSSSASASSSSFRSATKRLIKELAVWEKEAPTESGVERLGPVSEGELLQWEAVINGRGVGGGYEGKLLSLVSSRLVLSIPYIYYYSPLFPFLFISPYLRTDSDLPAPETYALQPYYLALPASPNIRTASWAVPAT